MYIYLLSMRIYLTDLPLKLCGIYKAISLWDKKSGSRWHADYGVNARTAAEKQVFDEWLKTPEVSLYDKHNNMMHADWYDKHTPLKAFAMKPWVYYCRMQAFMPGTQSWGTHSFNPGSLPFVLATQVLDKVNAEDDEEKDQARPPVDTLAADIPAAFATTMSSFFPHDPSTASFMGALWSDVVPPPLSSSISPTTHPNHVSQS